MRAGDTPLDELLKALPSIGTGIGLLFALVYAVQRVLHQDDEWERIVKQKDSDLAQLRTEVAVLKQKLDADRQEAE